MRVIAELKWMVHRAAKRSRHAGTYCTKKSETEDPSKNLHSLLDGACVHINLKCTYNRMHISNKCAFLVYCFLCVVFAENKKLKRSLAETTKMKDNIT